MDNLDQCLTDFADQIRALQTELEDAKTTTSTKDLEITDAENLVRQMQVRWGSVGGPLGPLGSVWVHFGLLGSVGAVRHRPSPSSFSSPSSSPSNLTLPLTLPLTYPSPYPYCRPR